jgi:hypothetical protein
MVTILSEVTLSTFQVNFMRYLFWRNNWSSAWEMRRALHWCWCYSYRLTMDESWSQTNVKCCAESAVICYIFSVMYGKNSVCSGSYGNKKANVMDNVCIQLTE